MKDTVAPQPRPHPRKPFGPGKHQVEHDQVRRENRPSDAQRLVAVRGGATSKALVAEAGAQEIRHNRIVVNEPARRTGRKICVGHGYDVRHRGLKTVPQGSLKELKPGPQERQGGCAASVRRRDERSRAWIDDSDPRKRRARAEGGLAGGRPRARRGDGGRARAARAVDGQGRRGRRAVYHAVERIALFCYRPFVLLTGYVMAWRRARPDSNGTD